MTRTKSPKFGAAGLCFLLILLASNGARASMPFWDPFGTLPVSNPSGDWEGNVWATSVGGTLGPWVDGNIAGFIAGNAIGAFTVTANDNHSIAGIYNEIGSSGSVTINGPGVLSIVSGPQGFYTATSGSTTIETALGGSGGVESQGSGSLYLYADNTYSGGTLLDSPLVYFNQNNSFGAGAINPITSLAALAATGGSLITLSNTFTITTSGGSLNFASAANTPVTSAGNWDLQQTLNLKNNGPSSAPLTLSGVVSDVGGLKISANNGGTILLSGANTYTGPTTVTSGTLMLGAANTISSSSSVILSGGTLNLGGFNHAMGSTTLGLTASSTIDFTAGGSTMSLTNSSALTWTSGAVLNLANWSSADTLQIGTDATGLTSAQLGDIEFNGAGLGTAEILSNGDVVQVPEPSMLGLGLVGGLGLGWKVQRLIRAVPV